MSSNGRLYLPALDGVRAIAAIMVMLFHYGSGSPHAAILHLGQTGVDLFFVLSGFLITFILLQAKRGDWGEIKRFYIRRTLRIFPLYYGYLLLSCLLAGAVSFWYWVYLQNIVIAIGPALHVELGYGPGHFWSLAVEEQFYLFWPFVILFWPRRTLTSVMWGAVAFALLLRISLAHTGIGLFFFTLTRIDSLAAGGLLAFYYSQGVLQRRRAVLCGIGLAGLVSLAFAKHYGHATGTVWAEVIQYSSAAAFYSAVIGLLVVTKNSILHRALQIRPMREIGKVSYGLYVYHPVVFAVVLRHAGYLPSPVRLVVCFALTYLVSVFSFYGFEKRFTDFKGRLAPQPIFRPAFAETSLSST